MSVGAQLDSWLAHHDVKYSETHEGKIARWTATAKIGEVGNIEVLNGTGRTKLDAAVSLYGRYRMTMQLRASVRQLHAAFAGFAKPVTKDSESDDSPLAGNS